MPKLTLGPAFFRKELHSAYSYWGEAFWREMIQNSVDAGAKLIAVQIAPGIESEVRITFTDDGCGMTRETLDNVFFKLGESTKAAGGASTGGFGRARIMTHFAQQRYEIITRDIHVKGVGEDYEYTEASHFRHGCQMVIDVLPITSWGSTIDMKAELVKYLSHCQLPCAVEINNERHTDWMYRRATLKPLSLNAIEFGTIHANKSAIGKDEDGKLVVRVNGTMMFKRSITPKVQVVFEIDPAQSRNVLASSRDSLNYNYRTILDAFIDELNTETKSALRKEEKESRPITGTGSFVTYKKTATAHLSTRGKKIAAEHSIFPDKVVVHDDGQAPEDAGDLLPTDVSSETAGRLSDAPTAPVKDAGPIVLDEAARNRMFDILMFTDLGEYTDAEKKAVRSVISAYNPLNWKVGYRKSQATDKNPTGLFFEGLQRAKLLLIWKTMCYHVVQEALEYFDMDKVSWGVGWNFDSDAAKHHTYEGVDYLLLNPVTRSGKMKYELRSQDDLDTLFMLAVHEVCHVKHKRHDEDFSTALTGLTARCLKRLPSIKKGIREVYSVRMV
jgi:hypothetical protein